MSKTAAFTAVCAEDACWVPNYLAEAERLNMPFAVHFDRCLLPEMAWHKLCIGHTQQPDPMIEFTEQHKQGIFDLVASKDFAWAMAWDIDETFEADAPRKIAAIEAMDCDLVDIRWLNLWGDPNHVRIDGTFGGGHRAKFYRLLGEWVFDHPITNGAKIRHREYRLGTSDLTCLHWGMMTTELRTLHKERWDRIYTRAVGANPYGFWREAVNLAIEPVVIKHGYFQ